jgi:hypothetical protein
LASEKAQKQLREEPEVLAVFIFSLVGGLALQRAADPRSVPPGTLARSMHFFLDNLFLA